MIRITNEQARELTDILDSVLRRADQGTTAGVLAEISRTVREQLNAPNHFNDLIDHVVGVLMEPRLVGTGLGRAQLDALRKAVLNPTELSQLQVGTQKLQQCADCGRDLLNGEAITTYNKQLYCHRCMHPESVQCPQCEEAVDVPHISQTIKRALQRHSGNCRVDNRAASAAASPVDPIVLPDPAMTRISRASRDQETATREWERWVMSQSRFVRSSDPLVPATVISEPPTQDTDGQTDGSNDSF